MTQPTPNNEHRARNLSIHPSTRLAARIAAASENTTLRRSAGEHLAQLLNEHVAIEPTEAPDTGRVSIVAALPETTWAELNDLRTRMDLTWDQMLRAALELGGTK